MGETRGWSAAGVANLPVPAKGAAILSGHRSRSHPRRHSNQCLRGCSRCGLPDWGRYTGVVRRDAQIRSTHSLEGRHRRSLSRIDQLPMSQRQNILFPHSIEWGIPFTDPTRNAIRPAWRVRDALLPVSTIPGPFRRWTIGFGTKQHAVITSGACAGRRALSARHASGRRPVATSRLLPRRVHFPLQSSPLKGQRPALPSARRAGRRRRPGAVSRDHWKARKSARFCGLGQ